MDLTGQELCVGSGGEDDQIDNGLKGRATAPLLYLLSILLAERGGAVGRRAGAATGWRRGRAAHGSGKNVSFFFRKSPGPS